MILTCGFHLRILLLSLLTLRQNLRCSYHYVSPLLHLLFVVGENYKVVIKVQILKLGPCDPLDSVPSLSSGFLHNPVNGKKKQEG